MHRPRRWTTLAVSVALLALPAGAQVEPALPEQEGGNITGERVDREAQPAGQPPRDQDEQELRPLWFILGAVAATGLAVGFVVMLRRR